MTYCISGYEILVLYHSPTVRLPLSLDDVFCDEYYHCDKFPARCVHTAHLLSFLKLYFLQDWLLIFFLSLSGEVSTSPV